MARRGKAISGWLNIDKPVGMTSTQVVGKARYLLGAAKAGHGGTLDPLASGILPLAFGEATKTIPYIVDGEKEYRFVVRWGEGRTTDDREGSVTDRSDQRPSIADITAQLPQFIGQISQKPPSFSAIKVDGARAYDLARDGEAVDLAARTVVVRDLSLMSDLDGFEGPDYSTFRLICGKGTYVRSIARDLGRLLGVYGHVADLRRLRVGPFGADHAISLDKLMDLVHSAPLNSYLLSVETALDGIPAVAVTESEAKRLRLGQTLRIPSSKQGTVCVKSADDLIALANLDAGVLKPLRVFNL